MFWEFPTKEDWRDLTRTYPFEKLQIDRSDFKCAISSDDYERFPAELELVSWVVHLQNRILQTRMSFVMMVFYFCKGIPDDEWYISPGKKGQSVEYFPHFEKQHHLTKAWFDYYADVFYYKLFSAWDTLGHLLNIMYGLEVDKPSFNRVLKKLKAIRPDLYTELKNLEDSPEFEQARKTRHDITHNLLPGHVGPGVQRVSKNDITFGVGSYTPSAKIKENAIKFLNLFGAALDAIKKQNAKDDPVRVA